MKETIASLKNQLQFGVTPAMATPVDNSGYQINPAVVPQLVNFLIGREVKGLFVGGTTGEGIVFSSEQRRDLLERVMAAAGPDFPILAHVGGLTTVETRGLASHAADSGAAAVVVVTPWYFGLDEAALFDFFADIAAVVPQTPLLVYDIPQAAVNGVTPSLLARLQAGIPNFAGLKCSRSDMQMIRALLDTLAEGLIFLAGNEPIALGSLALGADGMISGLATAVPEPFVALTAAFGRGDLAEGHRQQRTINRLLGLLPAGRRLGGIKRILQERGIPVGPTVPPRAMPDGEVWSKMEGEVALGVER